MNRNLAIKLGVIALLMALLMIPLLMIGGMVSDRQALRDSVLADIARSSRAAPDRAVFGGALPQDAARMENPRKNRGALSGGKRSPQPSVFFA